MARVFTSVDPSKLLGAEKVEEYKTGVQFCYGPSKDGKYSLMAIIEKSETGYVVDAESSVIALLPTATLTTEKPVPLYDTYVSAYGRRAKHVGPRVTGTLAGHAVVFSELSTTTWEQIRKREYQIVAPEPNYGLDLEDEIEIGINNDRSKQ